jgi:poly(3-hydroxyalkanoate) synthetase
MTKSATTKPASAPAALPFFWPLIAAAGMAKAGADLSARNLRFLAADEKILHELHPTLATPNQPLLDLRTMVFRDYSAPQATGLPTIVVAPYAGHSAMIADYQPGQSLMETLREHGVKHLFLTDWKSATEDMKDLVIDQYLAELNVCVDEIGGRANLVGLCQGGWFAAMFAARFPHKVESLVLAGSPIDAGAGHGPIKELAQSTSIDVYQNLVEMGGGLMQGRFMLMGWKNMHPDEHYFSEHVDLYEHIDDPAYRRKEEAFASWYENPINLPGRWYMQAIVQLFKENRFAKGKFVALGHTLNLKTITCPVYLLAGESDDITTPEQVLNARKYLGTPAAEITDRTVSGGHIGLFMGSHTLAQAWPEIAAWIAARSGRTGHPQHDNQHDSWSDIPTWIAEHR